MKKLITLFVCMSTLLVSAQDSVAKSSLQALISNNQTQIASLANAFSEEQYNWRPAEGIRSVGEAILHTAAANYFLATKLGFTPPDDVDMMGMEKITGKDNVMETLNKSFVFVLDKLGQINPDDYGKEVDLGFSKLSTLATMMVVLDHTGEHKGQLIAYARSVGVVPPWSN